MSPDAIASSPATPPTSAIVYDRQGGQGKPETALTYRRLGPSENRSRGEWIIGFGKSLGGGSIDCRGSRLPRKAALSRVLIRPNARFPPITVCFPE